MCSYAHTAIIVAISIQAKLGLAIQNIFDKQWKETQFDTESRLFNEAAPVSVHFSPGTPFFAKLSFTYNF
ncbi:hypothetical protein [Paraflavitalea speifideaquila]|uniref:hypothetical protein n=1 Tax=Paraflavitalea speifideaquila TaxID=3076558 RepID=UPI0028E2614B|nr:hypothetical protein [Paraflavitalea speifideiaquila]